MKPTECQKQECSYAQSPHKWWFTLKSSVFALNSSLIPFVGRGGGLVCETVGKADI